MTQEQKKKIEDLSVSEGYLTDWYITSVDGNKPIWTEAHIEELFKDFYLIPKDGDEKEEKVKLLFKVGDEVYNRYDKSLPSVVIEHIDDTTYYGDTTNFDIADQHQWGIVRSCENCKCGHYLGRTKRYDYPTVSCYLHKDCGGDEPFIIIDDDFVETAIGCKEFEKEYG